MKKIGWGRISNVEKSKFWGQLEVKLKKFIVKYQFEKDTELQGLNWWKWMMKLKKLKV